MPGANPDEGKLDVGERLASTGRDEGINLTQAVHRLLVPAIGRVAAIRRLPPGLELGELFAAEAELLLQLRPQGGKSERQRIPRSPRHLAGYRVDGGET